MEVSSVNSHRGMLTIPLVHFDKINQSHHGKRAVALTKNYRAWH